MTRRLGCALVHYPVLDRQSRRVTTAITNLDLHDIARSAHTFGVSPYYVVHPVAAQRELATRVRDHWTDRGTGLKRIPDRGPAMDNLKIVETLEQVVDDYRADAESVELWATSAQLGEQVVSLAAARDLLATPGAPVLILFGTGWGLAPEVMARCTRRLSPILSPRADGYNHLSVRAAAAILFERLLGVTP